MARSFSQEARSDSHKIGEMRYRMSHIIPSGTIARTLLLAGILLAVTVLASQSLLPAFAQEGPKMVDEGVSQVTTFTATDEDGDDITWSISDDATSPDEGDFEISQDGVLTFMNTPNYEVPTDDGDNNTYTVTVVATDSKSPPRMNTETITVMVINLNEPGVIGLSSLQPQENVSFDVTMLEDPDGEPNSDDAAAPVQTDLTHTDYEDTTNWQWARCSTMEVDTCVDIEENSTSTSYMPVEADRGHHLQVTATYADGHTPTPAEGEDEDIELDKTATAMSANTVLRANYCLCLPCSQIRIQPSSETAEQRARQQAET